MLRFSESTNEITGAVMAAVGIVAIYGGIGVCLLGEMRGMDISLAGCSTAAAAVVPLTAAAKQRDDRYQDLCAQLRTRRS